MPRPRKDESGAARKVTVRLTPTALGRLDRMAQGTTRTAVIEGLLAGEVGPGPEAREEGRELTGFGLTPTGTARLEALAHRLGLSATAVIEKLLERASPDYVAPVSPPRGSSGRDPVEASVRSPRTTRAPAKLGYEPTRAVASGDDDSGQLDDYDPADVSQDPGGFRPAR
jgi:hypothetical protein